MGIPNLTPTTVQYSVQYSSKPTPFYFILKRIFGVIRMPSIVLNTTHFLDAVVQEGREKFKQIREDDKWGYFLEKHRKFGV